MGWGVSLDLYNRATEEQRTRSGFENLLNAYLEQVIAIFVLINVFNDYENRNCNLILSFIEFVVVSRICIPGGVVSYICLFKNK